MAKVKDPVCGMDIESERAATTLTHKGKTYHFCSSMCKTKFSMNPDKFAVADGESAQPGHHHSH